ncbi:hypothetical protein Dsin_030092 [Dipteronia sinensis]|uniref:Uncharacterized protein n=1 Tax=Dipteronia sinensis TaxID=43782 RepID=A0AAE0DQM0_9ROSI|nr:hypothetical protein Dsin_030092 [Dipteronia sinensis]
MWKTRNNLVFEGKAAYMDRAVDMVKLRVVWWFKYNGKGSKEPVSSLLLNVKDDCVEHKKRKKINIQKWNPPADNYLKFNVDGLVRGKPGLAVIESIMRDSKGQIICSFFFICGNSRLEHS